MDGGRMKVCAETLFREIKLGQGNWSEHNSASLSMLSAVKNVQTSESKFRDVTVIRIMYLYLEFIMS